MKRYYFELLNESYDSLGVLIPDGSSKQTAINRAKRWMKENGSKIRATLSKQHDNKQHFRYYQNRIITHPAALFK